MRGVIKWIVCDGCKKKQEHNPDLYGGSPAFGGWIDISVRKKQIGDQEIKKEFCSLACVVKFFQEEEVKS